MYQAEESDLIGFFGILWQSGFVELIHLGPTASNRVLVTANFGSLGLSAASVLFFLCNTLLGSSFGRVLWNSGVCLYVCKPMLS